MITYEEALAIVLENTRVLEVEEKPLLECAGQVLAEDIYAEFSLPTMNQSGPDGYAVKAEDIKTACKDSPVTLKIVGTVRAGYLPQKAVTRGTAMRIMTGSVMPEGADCVVRFEDTDEPGNKCGPNKSNPAEVRIFVAVVSHANIRPAGSYVTKGSLVLPRGNVLGPAQIMALTTVGQAQVKVIRRPVLGVISTGDELIELGSPLTPGKAYDCNTTAVAALVSHYGGIPVVLGMARDNEKSILAKIRRGMVLDGIITSGGVAKGDYDLVRSVTGQIGEVLFSKISMGPGASVAYGHVNRLSNGQSNDRIPIFALSGPPVGCLINCETFLRPALFKMMGLSNLAHPVVEAKAQSAVSGVKAMSFVNWTALHQVNGEYQIELNRAAKIGMLGAIATANSLTIIPAGSAVKEGDMIKVLPLDWCRDQRP